MTQRKGEGSWLDVAAFTERVMGSLEPMIEEVFNRRAQESLDRQSISWMNLQVQKQREYREHRERREHREQRRFTGDQPAPDPTIPPSGAVNDQRVQLSGLVGAVNQVIKRMDALDKRFDRIDEQLAYLNRTNVWMESEPEPEPEAEEEAPDPDD